MQANSVLTSVLICQDSLSHPAVLFETDPELKLSARHESLVCPVPAAGVGISRVPGRWWRRGSKAMASHVLCLQGCWMSVVPWASLPAILFVMPPLVSSACFA